jgi:hypothetical protein
VKEISARAKEGNSETTNNYNKQRTLLEIVVAVALSSSFLFALSRCYVWRKGGMNVYKQAN